MTTTYGRSAELAAVAAPRSAIPSKTEVIDLIVLPLDGDATTRAARLSDIGRLPDHSVQPASASTSAAALVAGMLLIEVPSDQRSADAACNRPERTAAKRIACERTPSAACDRTDGTVAAAATVPVATAIIAIVVMIVRKTTAQRPA